MSHAAPEKTPHPLLNSNTLGATILTLAFVISLIVATVNTLRIERPTNTVIRLAHWQLEKGYPEAMQAVIDEYQRMHPGVEIQQTGISERFYSQWLNTQLISGTAPDICEMGKSDLVTKDEYTVKYFLPLSGLITQPNPYNVDNDLRDTPWKETLLDGMRGGFREGLQEYYGVPTTLTSMRLFYNKDLLRTTTGSDEPPRSFGQWMDQCKRIRAYAQRPGVDARLIPFVAAYKMDTMQGQYDVAFTSSYESVLDMDLDGTITPLETYIGYRAGKISLEDPAVLAMFKTLRRIGDQMQEGFSGMDRQQAQFMFANQQAVFMFSGSWDAGTFQSQADVAGFRMGVVEMPLPKPGEPFGEYVRGRANEASGNGAGVYGVFKGSKHTEQALDFIKFLSSRRGNELLNSKSQWPPLTIGAEPTELMVPFQPNPNGYNARVNFAYGTRVGQVVSSEIVNYYQGDAPFETFKKAYNDVIVDPNRGGDWAWWSEYDQRRRDARAKERVLAQDATLELIHPGSRDQARYRRAMLQQVIRNNAEDYRWMFRKYRDKDPNEAWKGF